MPDHPSPTDDLTMPSREQIAEDTMQLFIYRLNAFERAAQQEIPAAHGYGEKRQALLDFVQGLAEEAAFHV